MDTTVLLLGETGTGKELFAHALHDQSPRKDHPFVTVNCAAIPSSLLESELFGHEKGAFTGAIAAKVGRFEMADGAPYSSTRWATCRWTSRPSYCGCCKSARSSGWAPPGPAGGRAHRGGHQPGPRAAMPRAFRQDLYYRLGVFTIQIPPLRDRREDVPLLVWSFIQRRQAGLGRSVETIPRKAMEALSSYGWPGNVRELENVIERALILSPGKALKLDEAFGATRARCTPPPRHGAWRTWSATTSGPCWTNAGGRSTAPETPPKSSAGTPTPSARG